MTQPQPARPALLPDDLHNTLVEYLRFRHVFRSAYAFDLQWDKMSGLVLNVESTLQRLEQALDAVLASASPNDGVADAQTDP
jgi:hypothetical protein